MELYGIQISPKAICSTISDCAYLPKRKLNAGRWRLNGSQNHKIWAVRDSLDKWV